MTLTSEVRGFLGVRVKVRNRVAALIWLNIFKLERTNSEGVMPTPPKKIRTPKNTEPNGMIFETMILKSDIKNQMDDLGGFHFEMIEMVGPFSNFYSVVVHLISHVVFICY